jgi:dipeptidyl aminopeptidase/acylaminoacyl peptidase
MQTGRLRIPLWCCLLVAVLAVSGCFSGQPKPSKSPAETSDWSTVEKTTVLPGVVIERVTYRSGDLNIYGQVCRPASGGRHPVLIVNHGGFAGIGDWDRPNGNCASIAKAGWVVAESSYRGENGSDGSIEVCQGEVDDVLAMLDVVRTQSYADADRIAMVGISHGGCVTSRAVERGADIDAAVTIAGPTDWGPLVKRVQEQATNPSTQPGLKQRYRSLVDMIEKAVGGTPDEVPERYEERSPDPKKIARFDKPYLIVHGGADETVPAKQSCALANQIGGFEAYRLNATGGVETLPPIGCDELTWNDAPTPVKTFDNDRYLLVYEGVDHFLMADNGVGRIMPDLLRFLEIKLPEA